MSETAVLSRRAEAIREFYIRIDAGRADFIELFTDDFQFYFPKFGIGRGKAEMQFCAAGLGGSMRSLVHNLDDLVFFETANAVAVEGTTSGETADGRVWSAGSTPGGRFCSVFEFDGDLISRMHIYLDPDYGSADEARFLWGREGRTW